jgi:hypothetical protein
MEKSNLEKVNEKILVILLKEIQRELDGETEPEFEDFDAAAFDALKTMGLGNNSYIDYNFAFELYKKNIDNDFQIPLIRPKAGLYSIEVDVNSTEYVRRTYRHEISCYDESSVYELFRNILNEGDISVYDGDEIDYDVYDSETNDETVDNNSVKKIK